ncbi:hypothetical protein SRHO_G00289810 [Serrasalmus rhombeus]
MRTAPGKEDQESPLLWRRSSSDSPPSEITDKQQLRLETRSMPHRVLAADTSLEQLLRGDCVHQAFMVVLLSREKAGALRLSTPKLHLRVAHITGTNKRSLLSGHFISCTGEENRSHVAAGVQANLS